MKCDYFRKNTKYNLLRQNNKQWEFKALLTFFDVETSTPLCIKFLIVLNLTIQF